MQDVQNFVKDIFENASMQDCIENILQNASMQACILFKIFSVKSTGMTG